MPVPQNRQQLLAAIETSFDKLQRDLATIPESQARERTLDGHAQGTLMSVHDLVAYLVGWNELVLKWHAGRQAGRAVDFPETGYRWNELGQLAQKFYADYADVPFPDLLQRLTAAKTALVALIEGLDDTALYGVPWYEKYTLGRMIQFNTSSPYSNARARLRAWRKHR